MIILHRNKYFTIAKHSALIILFITACVSSLHHECFAQLTNHLAEGIKLYKSGDFDGALNELRIEVEINPHCPLAYYYAAKIRIEKEQYSRAKQNLEAAIRDSSGFHDANGLLAYILSKMGQETEALAAWNGFIQAVGTIEGNTPLTVKSITIPEEYHKKLQLVEERKERERLEAEKKERLRQESEEKELKKLLAEEKIDSKKRDELNTLDDTTETEISTQSDQLLSSDNYDDTIAEIETPMDDLEKRIRSRIRTGIYSIIVATAILGIGIYGLFFWFKKRREKKEELTFSDEVARLLIDNEIELNEEEAIKEFEAKKLELQQEEQPPEELPAPEEQIVHPVIEPYPVNTKQPLEETIFPGDKMKSPITEEVKALVSRLYREGHSAEEIARTADLTKTEVNLILAVRERHTSSLIEEINREENLYDRDQLIHAIHDLSAEGVNMRDIAKKLNISTSEVNLASMIIDMRKKNLKS